MLANPYLSALLLVAVGLLGSELHSSHRRNTALASELSGVRSTLTRVRRERRQQATPWAPTPARSLPAAPTPERPVLVLAELEAWPAPIDTEAWTAEQPAVRTLPQPTVIDPTEVPEHERQWLPPAPYERTS